MAINVVRFNSGFISADITTADIIDIQQTVVATSSKALYSGDCCELLSISVPLPAGMSFLHDEPNILELHIGDDIIHIDIPYSNYELSLGSFVANYQSLPAEKEIKCFLTGKIDCSEVSDFYLGTTIDITPVIKFRNARGVKPV